MSKDIDQERQTNGHHSDHQHLPSSARIFETGTNLTPLPEPLARKRTAARHEILFRFAVAIHKALNTGLNHPRKRTVIYTSRVSRGALKISRLVEFGEREIFRWARRINRDFSFFFFSSCHSAVSPVIPRTKKEEYESRECVFLRDIRATSARHSRD